MRITAGPDPSRAHQVAQIGLYEVTITREEDDGRPLWAWHVEFDDEHDCSPAVESAWGFVTGSKLEQAQAQAEAKALALSEMRQ